MRRQLAAVMLVLAWAGCGAGETRSDDVAPRVTAQNGGFGTMAASAPPETAHWGELAGVWRCTVQTPTNDGSDESAAIWTWRYILGGHAVQDVYEGIRADGSPSFFGTGLRVYHPNRQSWEISWVANSAPAGDNARTSTFSATSTPGRVEMSREGDPDWSTVFYDIGPDRFLWQSQPSGQRMVCDREA